MRLSDFVPPIVGKAYRRIARIAPPRPLYEGVPVYLYYHPALGSFSQFGEDLILSLLLRNREGRGGAYIDVGANDPEVLSNTKRLYDKGWRGITIEPTLALHDKHLVQRPGDIALAVGCGAEDGAATFYEMSHDTLSTFSHEEAAKGDYNSQIVRERQVPIRTLASICDEHLAGREIDLLSVDVEGTNLDVLRGNDWNRFRPLVMIVEITLPERATTLPFIEAQGYVRVYDNTLNPIFVDEARLSDIG